MTIPPYLPPAEKLLPYLKRIDKNRYYTNAGPLVLEFEKRLAELFGAPCVTASSATSALTACLIALELPPRSLVACPSWTFIATPASIVAAGYIPYFVEVGRDGRMLTLPSAVDAVVYVAPFGMPSTLLERPKMIPIIIDAAAGFDSFSRLIHPQFAPVVISTHATKTFCTGEGGFVTCHDKRLLNKVRAVLNFGRTNFGNIAPVTIPFAGINGKMSEYHAAVGLAELDGWEEKRDKFLRKTKIYGLNYATALVPTQDGEGRKGVYGCHKHIAYRDFPRMELPITEELMKKTSCVVIGVDP